MTLAHLAIIDPNLSLLQFDHGAAAKKMTSMLKLPFKLEKSDVQEHLEVMFAKFMEEKKKEKASKWNWMGQLQEKS